MKEYNVLVSENIKRFCKVIVLADSQEDAINTVRTMWQNDELDNLMADSALGASFNKAEIITE